MSADPFRDLKQCEREIAECAAYEGPDEVGAAMGWADNMIEREYIRKELAAPKPYYEEAGITIYHGDCRVILPTLPNVDLVLTDPPYGIGYTKYESHIDDPNEYPQLLRDSIGASERLVSNGWCCVFQAAKLAHKWGEWFGDKWRLVALPKTFVQILPGMGPTWATDYALAWPCGTPTTERGKGRDWFVCETSDMSKRPKGHPCPRPLNGIRYLSEVFSNAGGLILDPFMGSGTTLVAAKQLGRRAIGIEIEERYCEIAAKRLAQAVLDFTEPTPEPEQGRMF